MRENESVAENPTDLRTRDILLFTAAVFILSANVVTIYYLLLNQDIFVNGFWVMLREFRGQLLQHPNGAATTLFRSMQHNTYNDLGIVPLLPLSFVFGLNRLGYTLNLVNVYFIPSFVIYFILIDAIYKQNDRRFLLMGGLSIALIYFAQPHFWYLTFRGHIDIGVLIMLNGIILFLFHHPIRKQRLYHLLLLGLLCAIAILFRRWLSIWITALFVSLAGEQCCLWLCRKIHRREFFYSCLKLFLAALCALALLLVFAWSVTITALSTNYHELYSAYGSSGNFFTGFWSTIQVLGLSSVVIALVSIMYSFARFPAVRSLIVFLVVQSLVFFVLFFRIQRFDPHHFLGLLPVILLSTGLCVSDILLRIRSLILRLLIFVIIAYFVLSNILTAFFFPHYIHPFTTLSPHFFTSMRLLPRVREDMNEFNKLRMTLNTLIDESPGRIYVLSDGSVLKFQLLQYAYVSFLDGPDQVNKNTNMTAVVDKVNGFPQNFFTAKYVVVANPILSLIKPEDSQVMHILADALLQGKTFAHSYDKRPEEFHLDRGVTVSIFERKRPIRKTDIAKLSSEFRAIYPDHPKIFSISVPQNLLSE
ncbi:hypothetical protein AUJ46_01800 [Candidatus Peregrinibacteria bacterium CG1_02_54_53]|nr:MAG: hypothetical protein AUJ46_01800 [Candidatus Peregrinibacteria bacterium CG1_02_54_53]